MMHLAFIEFVVANELLEPASVEHITKQVRYTRDAMGTIAHHHDVLDLNDIQRILTKQREDHLLFGEAAIQLGLLTSEQLETLLVLQQFEALMDVVGALALADPPNRDEVFRQLGRFLSRTAAHQSVPSGST